MWIMKGAALGIAAVLSAATARAESQPIDIADDASWVHEDTGITAPPAIDGLRRFNATSYLPNGANNGFSYSSEDEGELLSLYVYRAGFVDVAMWGDVAMMSMAANASYDGVDYGKGHVSLFGDDRIGTDSGIRFVMPVQGKFRATGLALYALDRWLVKLRYSSAALDPQALDARLAGLVRQIAHAPPARPAPAAYRVEQCGKPIKEKKARRAALDGGQMLVQAMGYSLIFDETREKAERVTAPGPVPRLCRDMLESQGAMLVYRPVDNERGYRIALGDSGISISVSQGMLPDDGETYWAALSNGSAVELYRPFDGLPRIEQTMDAVSDESPVAAVTRKPEGGSDVRILALE
ncbi:hypothetical protein [Croceicoccus marinus]|uniref:DUF1254 domain-containing protein n=1 Tax=Croceicoccus marinus TaxID=450378 RepID=A0A1Z1FBJ4_9SPHN|nr:hypothetical protein [Croceicoccus marinus]ARU16122.1 hypothetical protein A9D14_07820 [Croceicoccus marinus]